MKACHCLLTVISVERKNNLYKFHIDHFHTMAVHSDQAVKLQKGQKLHNKSSLYALFAIFWVFWSYMMKKTEI